MNKMEKSRGMPLAAPSSVEIESILILFRRVLFILALVGIYLQLSTLFPYDLFFASTALLAVVSYSGFSRYMPLMYFAAFGAFMLSMTALYRPVDFNNQASSTIMLCLSIFGSLTFSVMAERLGQRRMEKWFWWVSVVLVGGAILERLGVLSSISDAVRVKIYSPEIIYDGVYRDLSDYGFLRPKLFTSEPSHLGKFLAIFTTISAALSERRLKHIALTVVGYIVISSPVILISLPMIALFRMREKGWRTSLRSPAVVVPSLIILTASAIIVRGIAIDRLGFGGGQVEASAFMRIIRPYLVMTQALSEHPLFGFGLGSDQIMQRFFFNAAFDVSAPEFFRRDPNTAGGTTFGNVHFGLVSQFGIIGGIIWLFCLDQVRKNFGSSAILFWSFYILYGLFAASVNTPILMWPIAMIACSTGRSLGGGARFD